MDGEEHEIEPSPWSLWQKLEHNGRIQAKGPNIWDFTQTLRESADSTGEENPELAGK